MKILVVSQYYWPENFRINDLVSGLSDRGHKVTVLTGIPNYPAGRFFPGYGVFRRPEGEDKTNVPVVRVPLIARGVDNKWRLFLNYLSFALSASLLGPLCCRDGYDVIFVFEPSPITVGIPALVMKFFRRCPVVFWVQDLWPESLSATGVVSSKKMLGAVACLVRGIFKGCDLILATSRSYIPSIVSHNVPEAKVRYFPQSVEALYRPLSSDQIVSEKKMLPGGFIVMFAGNIGTAQSFETIIEAAEMLRDERQVNIVVIGDGRRFLWLKEEIERRALEHRVFLLGRQPLEKMPAFFACADALLVSLRKDPLFALTVPGKVQSYMACGKPIIAALEGEGAQLVNEAKAGLTCAPGDAEALASTIRTMAGLGAKERGEMGAAGYQYFKQHFDRDMLIDRLEGWMADLRGAE